MARPSIFTRISRFLGLPSLQATGRDAYLIISLRSLRMFAAGIPSLILALFFSSLGFPDSRIGLFMTFTLLGDVILSLLLTLVADSLGRRKVIFLGSAMMSLSGIVFALSENFWVLLAAAVCGVISVTGGDVGPFRAVEESMLSGLTDQKTRSDVLTWYVTATTLAGAVGTEVAGRVVQFVEWRAGDEKKAFHVLFWGYALVGGVGCVLSLGLSQKCEVTAETNGVRRGRTEQRSGTGQDEEEEVLLEAVTPSTIDSFDEQAVPQIDREPIVQQKTAKKTNFFSQISKPTLTIIWKLWILLGIDSLADGMTPYSLMNYYVHQKFHLSKSTLGDITSASQFLCAVSSIFAGPLAKQIGLINTMVFTHLPSSISLAFIPLPKSVGWTVGLLLFRAALNNMDQAPRTAFIAAVVRPEERTAVMGVTSTVRTLAMSVGPSITGLLAGNGKFWVAFLASGICRVIYDFGLWILFVNVKVDKENEEGNEDADSVDDEAWDGLLSGSDSEESIGRLSKDGEDDVGKRV